MKFLLIMILGIVGALPSALAAPKKPAIRLTAPGPQFYRELTMRIRPEGTFRVYMPDGRHQDIRYNLEFGEPVYPEVKIGDYVVEAGKPEFNRLFWDRILLKDGSIVEIGGEKLPLTCIVVSAKDNRFSGPKSPLIPDYIIGVHLVANDFSCQGPIRPGWPETGGRKENWDTYLHFEVKDPTIMLPQDAEVRYRWNEFNAIWIDAGTR